MSALTGEIKKLLQIKFKHRQDSVTDQYSRIFMVKMMLIFGMLTGINWFKDDITCIIPKTAGLDGKFVNQACWIQGLYVYRSMDKHDQTSYFGIPMDIEYDGIVGGTESILCATKGKGNRPAKNCNRLVKTFYLQYQWFPFYVACLGILFYIPYMVFSYVNRDIKQLKESISIDSADKIVKTFFNHEVTSRSRMLFRVLGNLLVKVLYIVSNVTCFLVTDSLFNNDFRNFGQAWAKWSDLDNEQQYKYSPHRSTPTPGNHLLPTFGLCEVVEASVDLIVAKSNVHRFLCEISMHVLYQYVLITMWFLVVIGITISCVGLVKKLFDHIWVTTCFLTQGSKVAYKKLSLREVEYLEYIRRKNLAMYRDVVQKIGERLHDDSINGYPMKQYSPEKGHEAMEDDRMPFMNGGPEMNSHKPVNI